MGAKATYTINAKDRTKAAFKSVRRNVGGVSKAIFGLKTAVLGLAGAAGFGLLIKSSLAAGDSLAKTSDKLGIATEKLAGLRHAAELSGVASNTMDMALQRMVRRVSEAAQGTGEARGALFRLGLQAKELAKQNPDQQFRAITEAMQGVAHQGDRVRLAMRLFDTEGVALVNTMNMGTEALDRAAAAAKAYGTALSRTDAAKIEAANDAIFEAKQAIKGVFLQISVHLAPWITELTTRFTDLAKKTGGFKEQVNTAFQFVVKSVAYAMDAIQVFRMAWLGLKGTVMIVVDVVRDQVIRIVEAFVKVRQFFDEDYPEPVFLTVLKNASNETKTSISGVITEIDKIRNAEWNHEAAMVFFAAVDERANQSAEVVAAARQAMFGTPDEREAQAEAELEEQLNREARIQAHLERIAMAERNYSELTQAIWLSGWQGKAKIIGGILKTTAGLMQSQNKKMFEIGKKASIANTVIQTAQMAVKSFNALADIPYVGPFLGAAAAAAAIAYGKVQIDNIKSQQFQGGGTVSASRPNLGGAAGGGGARPPGGGPGPGPGGPVQAPTRQIDVTIVGQGFSGDDMRDLIDGLNEQVGDDVNLNARIET